jgi:hypothetical protein
VRSIDARNVNATSGQSEQAEKNDRRNPAALIDDKSGGEPDEPHSERGVEKRQKVEGPSCDRHHRKPRGSHPVDERRKLEIAGSGLARECERLGHIEVDG